MKRRMIWIAGVTLSLTTAGIVLGLGGPSSSRPATSDEPLAHRWPEGQSRTYEIDCEGESRSDLRGLTGVLQHPAAIRRFTPTSSRVRIQGELELTSLAANPHRLAVRLNQAQVLVSMGPGVLSRAPDTLHADLAHLAVATLHSSGRIVSLSTARGVSRAAAGVLRSLLGTIQISLPEGERRHAWTARESDPYGRYVAAYQIDGTGAGDAIRTIRKRKIHYLPRPAGPREERFVATFESAGERVARFDSAAGALMTLTGIETLLTRVSGRSIATTRTRVRLRLLDTARLGSMELARLRKGAQDLGPAQPLDADDSAPAMEHALHRRQLGGATVSSLLDELGAASKQTSLRKQTQLGMAFDALAALRREDCPKLGQALKRMDPRGWKATLVASALAKADHLEAQSALASALREHLRRPARAVTLVSVLTTIPTPSREIESLLRQVARESSPAASTAVLTLGTVARRLASSAPKRAARLVRWGLRRLHKAATASQRRQWILFLGNAGRAAPANELMRLATRGDARTRAVALWALRWQPGSAVEAVLSRAAGSEVESRIRKAARRALAARRRARIGA